MSYLTYELVNENALIFLQGLEKMDWIRPVKKSLRQTLSLAEQARLALVDYENDRELTAFTSIDSDEFYETK